MTKQSEVERLAKKRGRMRKYIHKNKDRLREYNKQYRKENPWFRHGNSAKQRCTNKNDPSYCWYGARGIKYLLTSDDLKRIWNRDKAHLLKQPSIDRINSDGNYEPNNVRFIELGLNSHRANVKRWKDAEGKWTSPCKGEKNHRAKLSEKQAKEILRKYDRGVYTGKMLADEYGICEQTIYNIVNGITWKHLPAAKDEIIKVAEPKKEE